MAQMRDTGEPYPNLWRIALQCTDAICRLVQGAVKLTEKDIGFARPVNSI